LVKFIQENSLEKKIPCMEIPCNVIPHIEEKLLHLGLLRLPGVIFSSGIEQSGMVTVSVNTFCN
jgi:hypothetical protein